MATSHEAARQQAEVSYYSALDHYAEGRLTEAISDYNAAIASDPTVNILSDPAGRDVICKKDVDDAGDLGVHEDT